MADKVYWWIKLRTDFFDLPAIDYLCGQKNGCEYVVLYQKLCLLSSNNNGELSTRIGEMLVPYDVEKIARDTKFSVDTVVVALELFAKLGLIYRQENGVLYMPAVSEMVGHETDEARRKRLQRAKKTGALPAPEDGTSSGDNPGQSRGQCPNKSLEYKSIENKSLEIEHTPAREEIGEVKAMYRSICKSLPELSELENYNRDRDVLRLLAAYPNLDMFRTVFEKAEASAFLRGGGSRGFRASFGWLMKQDNFVKVYEGQYDDSGGEGNIFLDMLGGDGT